MSYDLTPQQIFDKVATHLFKQGKPAKHEGSCVYRAPDGCMCAVGVLIADDDYSDDLEGLIVESLISSSRTPTSLLTFLHSNKDLLKSLQKDHDDCPEYKGKFVDESVLRERLTSTATKYNLSPAILADLHFPEKSV